jgi:HK97 family phage prohead protease
MGAYERYDLASLREFIKLYCRKDGTLAEPLDMITTGIIVKAEDDSETFPWVFSTGDCDRFDERVDPAGWDFTAYNANPVVLWAHNHAIPAIGISEGVTVADSLTGRIRFNEREYDEFGWSIGERVRNGIIRAGSVGFRVLEIEWVDHAKQPEEKCDLIFRKQELLEFSICNVPANPFALRTDSLGEFGDAKFSTTNEDTGSTAPTSKSEKNSDRTGFRQFVRNTERRRQLWEMNGSRRSMSD